MPEILISAIGLFVVFSAVQCTGDSTKNLTLDCEACNKTLCEAATVPCGLNGETKDRCGCCPTCAKLSKEELCKTVECPRKKICTLNIQGIPMCRCPSVLSCPKRVKLLKRYCASDGITYKSRCAMQVSECQNKKKLRVNHRGPCINNEKDRILHEKLKEKLAKKTRKRVKKEKRRRKFLRRRRRMRRMMRTGFRKRRMN